MNTPSLKGQVHEEIEKIFRTLLPRNGLAVREEQVTLCHIMLDALLKNNIALCDAGVGIGKTYAYLTGCILLRKNAPHSAVGSLPVVVSTSSIALQDAIIEEYIPFLSRIFLENHIIQKPIRAIVRKGKERFVCDVRLAQRLEAVKDKKKNIEQLEALLSLRTYHDLDLPIYHTVAESSLQKGAGHMPGTSLPIGGKSTHTVISAHSGIGRAHV